MSSPFLLADSTFKLLISSKLINQCISSKQPYQKPIQDQINLKYRNNFDPIRGHFVGVLGDLTVDKAVVSNRYSETLVTCTTKSLWTKIELNGTYLGVVSQILVLKGSRYLLLLKVGATKLELDSKNLPNELYRYNSTDLNFKDFKTKQSIGIGTTLRCKVFQIGTKPNFKGQEVPYYRATSKQTGLGAVTI